MRQDSPGRIPESLIDAAIDGELNEDMQREIAHALKYDLVRKSELIDTTNAIHALQMPVSTPCFADSVLHRVDQRKKFIPSSWRKHVRTGRLGIAAALLLSLMTVAGLQRVYPRLTTLGSHPTPVLDIENAIETGAGQLATTVTNEVETYRASVAPIASLLSTPGRVGQRFEVSNASTVDVSSYPSRTVGEIRLVGVGNGIAAIYLSDQVSNPRFPTRINTPSSTYVVGSSRLSNWAYHSGMSHRTLVSSPKSKTEQESSELDVSALP
jgi:hypothetical protein